MIFIGGIHGVGKTYFCNRIKECLGVETYSASSLIAERKNQLFTADKLVLDIDANQQYLLLAVEELRRSRDNFLLDGHFCLLNESGLVTRVAPETFTSLRPNGIIVLTEVPATIATRRRERDGYVCEIESIACFQNEEIAYAEEIAGQLAVDLRVLDGGRDIEDAIEFIKKHGEAL